MNAQTFTGGNYSTVFIAYSLSCVDVVEYIHTSG